MLRKRGVSLNQNEIEFNLLDEPWIRIQMPDLQVQEVSLTDALLNAHQYKDLAGETPTQNIAILRVLLAVMHTVFGRMDVDGTEISITDHHSAVTRWASIWNMNCLPETPIKIYLCSQHDQFWLFHPEHPFWQVPAAIIGTYYSAAKLNGEMMESENKSRLFLPRLNQVKDGLSYAEAARWILHVNGYDDTSAKPKGKGLPSPGAGYLGKIGPFIAKGKNLFETLMLNFVLLRDGVELWNENHPVWERPIPKADERTEITVPNNPAELLTLQSRRLLLKRDNHRVIGYFLLGGDFFVRENAFVEQMTVWRPVTTKKNSEVIDYYLPRQHDDSKQMWRDFTAFFVRTETQHQPGIILWLEKLKSKKILPKSLIFYFYIVGIKYGDKDFFVTDIFSDSLSIHSGIITELGFTWQKDIEKEVNRCDCLAVEIGNLANNLALAAGNDAKIARDDAKKLFYSRVDIPFRRWLHSLDPESNNCDPETAVDDWCKTVKSIALNLGKELVNNTGKNAFVGRMVTIKTNGREVTKHYSSPEAFNWFVYNLKKHF